MSFFSGEYTCKLDAKGRMVLPARLKSMLTPEDSHTLTLLRGFEPCLVMYPQSAWRKVFDKVAALNEFNEEYRNFQRNFLRGSTEIELDAMGRFIIPRTMAAYAGIDKTIVVVGIANRIELWEEGRYESYLIRDMKQFSQHAQSFLSQQDGDMRIP